MKKNQKGFTLMELMVVIVIVAILAAVAVPLYINYVKDAQMTEAKGAIGAIISAEQTYFQRSAIDDIPGEKYGTMAELGDLVDVREARMHWDFQVVPDAGPGYLVTATEVGSNRSNTPVIVTYTFTRPGPDGSGGKSFFTP